MSQLAKKEEKELKMTKEDLLIGNLGQDVFALILEFLRNVAPEFLQELRTISRAWNQAVIPTRYRSIELTANLFSAPDSVSVRPVLTHIRRHARHISIREELDWSSAIELISGCSNITRINWEWWGDRHAWLDPETYGTFKAIKSLWPQAEIHLINYPWPSKNYPDIHTQTIPLENIVFISTCTLKNRRRNFKPLETVVAQSPKLKVLQLKATNLEDWKSIRVPPIRELILDGCGWKLTSSEVSLMWDFTHLESLEINPIVPANSFFASLQTDSLQQLRRLKITAALHPHYPLVRESLTRHLDHFIAGGNNLEEIELFCHVPLLRMTSISKHSSLKVLKIHDYTGFHYEWEICPSFSLKDMTALSQGCPNIRELSLDLDQRSCEVRGFVEILSSLRNLQFLTLKMRSILSETGVNSSTIDADFEAAKELRSLLCSKKAGLPMVSLTLYTAGYDERPNRDSDAWKLQRQQDHNPERCFEFSWLPDGSEVLTSLTRTY